MKLIHQFSILQYLAIGLIGHLIFVCLLFTILLAIILGRRRRGMGIGQ
jgi:hypothetical protein